MILIMRDWGMSVLEVRRVIMRAGGMRVLEVRRGWRILYQGFPFINMDS